MNKPFTVLAIIMLVMFWFFFVRWIWTHDEDGNPIKEKQEIMIPYSDSLWDVVTQRIHEAANRLDSMTSIDYGIVPKDSKLKFLFDNGMLVLYIDTVYAGDTLYPVYYGKKQRTKRP